MMTKIIFNIIFELFFSNNLQKNILTTLKYILIESIFGKKMSIDDF